MTTYKEKEDFGIELFCRDCRHSWFKDGNGEIAECRYNPPVRVDYCATALFPRIDIDDYWCARGETFGSLEKQGETK